MLEWRVNQMRWRLPTAAILGAFVFLLSSEGRAKCGAPASLEEWFAARPHETSVFLGRVVEKVPQAEADQVRGAVGGYNMQVQRHLAGVDIDVGPVKVFGDHCSQGVPTWAPGEQLVVGALVDAHGRLWFPICSAPTFEIAELHSFDPTGPLPRSLDRLLVRLRQLERHGALGKAFDAILIPILAFSFLILLAALRMRLNRSRSRALEGLSRTGRLSCPTIHCT